jgi:cell division septation protein DedD
MAAEDTEITLGTGKLLGLFFMLAAICGIFFAVGYSLGKTSAREQALNDRAAEQRTSSPVAESSGDTSERPTPRTAETATQGVSSAGGTQQAKSGEPNLTFYDAVKRNGTEEKPELRSTQAESRSEQKPSDSDSAIAATAAKQNTSSGSRPQLQPSTQGVAPASQPSADTSTAASSGAFLVQIAAVTHEDDAAALASALRKKSYAASVVNNPSGKDKLFHVVVGPYANLQDAEAMKLKLEGEGYKPILKR